MTKLAKTHNTLGENTRLTSVGLLNAALADLIDLGNAVKMAHWNVRGPQFVALHQLFENFHGQIAVAVDDTAERVVQLGGSPQGTTQQVGATTRLAPYSADIRDGLAHVAALTERYAALATTSREAIDTSAEAGDADTADLFTATSRMLDKALWMLEAHLG
jgi:starvation-inducible DNA-binding protein